MMINDLRYFCLRHKRYPRPDLSEEEWMKVKKFRNQLSKRVAGSAFKWYVVTYRDGRKELTRITYRWGIIGAMSAALYRGVFPRMWTLDQLANVTNVRLAF